MPALLSAAYTPPVVINTEVTTLADGPIDHTDGEVTLREAIDRAYADVSADLIHDGGGVWALKAPVEFVPNHEVVTHASLGDSERPAEPAATIRDTIIAENYVGQSGTEAERLADIVGLRSAEHSLIGVGDPAFSPGNGNIFGTLSSPIDPKLGPLSDNGGLTKTHALMFGSPAFNAGSNASPPQFDSRGEGYDRIFNEKVDIGAYEVQMPRHEFLAATAANLREDHGFHFDTSYYTGTLEQGELWFRDRMGTWYYILPSGHIYKYGAREAPINS
ncbi:MAG: choice-of-anchor Q domain-containing protein [Gemmataceae bacterium]